MEGIIYKFTNRINNKVYIGQTINEKERYLAHKRCNIKECPKFHNAIDKYGFENFEYEVIYRGDESTLDKEEIYYINSYNSTNDIFGYNITPGGKSLRGEKNPFYGKHHTKEENELMINNRRSYKGKNHPRYHKGFLLEYNNKIYSSNELAKVINCTSQAINLHIRNKETEFNIKGHQIKLYKKGGC